ncbi:YicC/YloC family endoribonuclease [Ruminococcus gauvreauii]|uniref:YicC family protein n=1 Tax=Ruminococcus gauvreauii TaxID=438033 RepID=A0ABY5VGJ6_9FIRM|nr:YicC/YloC family endoribonuclease [Ruminococcus gauvreauii]UWP59539.1 YicC family protein [Ruminococcus gauvreauii]
MMKSMTGFGRSEVQDEQYRFTVEMKSVNHRYLDFNFKIPKKLSLFESAVRSVLKEYMQRGKVDVFITYENYTQSRISLKYNRDIARQYLDYLQEMERDFSIENDITVSGLSRYPEVFTMEEQPADEEELWGILEQALRNAAKAFSSSREKEGADLKNDLLEKLEGMQEKVAAIEVRSPEIMKEYREKLEKKLGELLEDNQIEESRIAAEVILFADKICTDEETVRLKSHIDNMRHVLSDGDGIGRKLDFIAQEMNREANTILSKANDLETSNIAIDLKTEIEKVREQIQNIE